MLWDTLILDTPGLDFGCTLVTLYGTNLSVVPWSWFRLLNDFDVATSHCFASIHELLHTGALARCHVVELWWIGHMRHTQYVRLYQVSNMDVITDAATVGRWVRGTCSIVNLT